MFAKIWHNFKRIDYKYHLLCAFLIRLVVICYGSYHDKNFPVPFTDIDYKVFTDAARHVLNNRSPYDRRTYRYSPFIAFLLTPNILFHNSFGKILFSFIDIVVAILMRSIIKHNLKQLVDYKQNHETELKLSYLKKNKINKTIGSHHRKKGKPAAVVAKTELETKADLSVIVWLYNPMTIGIATRGNCDSIAGLFVLTTLFLLQCRKQPFLAGLIHGIAVHVRLYPIMYSLALFMHLSKYSFYSVNSTKFKEGNSKTKDKYSSIENKNKTLASCDKKRKTIFKLKYLSYLIPNFEQLKLILGSLLSLTFLTSLFYSLYGFAFLHESYIYHFLRKDTKHNFSLYFYLQYLTAEIKNVGIWQKVLTVLPQILLLCVFSVCYGLNKLSLNFAILVITVSMVTYNTVLTSQYFIWVLAILPLCLWQIQMSMYAVVILLTIWFAAQISWLLPAYFLEFQGHNTFMFIWIQSISLFCAHIVILGRIIKCFMLTKCDNKIL